VFYQLCSNRNYTLKEIRLVAYDYDTLRRIYDRTDGDCHLCCGRLSFSNYANHGSKVLGK
jgi:hypothetical protein